MVFDHFDLSVKTNGFLIFFNTNTQRQSKYFSKTTKLPKAMVFALFWNQKLTFSITCENIWNAPYAYIVSANESDSYHLLPKHQKNVYIYIRHLKCQTLLW